jgi:hypothetical protein
MFSTPTVRQSGTTLHVEHGNDSNLYVEFRMEPVHQPFLSEKEGRPIFKDVPYIRILTPGDKTKVIDRPVDDGDQRRFPRQWEAFKSQGINVLEGTPILEWSPLTKSEAMELKALGFHTVEQLASARDDSLSWLGAVELRKKAQTFLAASKDNSFISKMNGELAQRDADILALKNQLAELTQRVAGSEDDQPKKRGRPAKPEE